MNGINPMGTQLAPFLRSTRVFRNLTGGEQPFDPQKLAKIRATLEKEGITFVIGEEGERLARALGGEAMYIPELGRPGIIVLGNHPSRSAVIEELLHLGQHRRFNWGDVIPFGLPDATIL